MESPSNLHEDVENLSNLFHDALTSMSEEVDQIRYLTSLSKVLQPSSAASTVPSQGVNHPDTENLNPNIHPNLKSQDDPSVQFTNTILNQLQFLSDKITQMENKAKTIQQVIEEENQALDMMKMIRNAALNQKAAIESVWSDLGDQNILHSLPGLELFRSGYRINTISNKESEESDHREMSTLNGSGMHHHTGRLVTQSSKSISNNTVFKVQNVGTGVPPNHNILESDWIHLEPISQTEYQSIPKTILGRISLSDLNSALNEIHHILIEKYKLLHPTMKHSNKSSQGSKERFTSADHDIYQDGLPFVTEEELRKECAFFVLEATARGILRVLRSTQRIKHVSCRHLEIRYAWLNCGSNNDDLN